MSWAFKEENHSKLYMQHRPTYPDEVYKTFLSWLPTEKSKWKTAVDVGCGTGQSTLPLCDYFEEVIGIDSSETQLSEAQHVAASQNKQNVKYMTGVADDLSFLGNDSIDLVTAATATHWFDFEKFFQESRRILKPGGVLAVYSYGFVSTRKAEGQKIISQFYREKLADFRPKLVDHVENRYSDVYACFSNVFPVSQRVDSIRMDYQYRLDELLRILESSSLYQRYRQENPEGADILKEAEAELRSVYMKESDGDLIDVFYPLFLLLGRKDVAPQQTCG